MECSIPGFRYFTVSWSLLQPMSIDSDVIQQSHSLLPPSPHALNLSQHQNLFQWTGSSRQVAKVLVLQLQHQSFQWIFRVDIIWYQESPTEPQFESINSPRLSLLYGPTITLCTYYWKNHSFDYVDLCRKSDVSAFYTLQSYDKLRQNIKKQRHYFADKGLYSQSYVFSSSHV